MHHSNRMYLRQKYILFTPADLAETPLPIAVLQRFPMGRTEFFGTSEFQVTYRWINKLYFYLKLLQRVRRISPHETKQEEP